MVETIYLAGSITDNPNYKQEFQDWDDWVTNSLDYIIINPLYHPKYSGSDPQACWNHYMRHSVKELADCDAILMLPGWENSRGASIEYWLADALGINIYYGIEDGNKDRMETPGVSEKINRFGIISSKAYRGSNTPSCTTSCTTSCTPSCTTSCTTPCTTSCTTSCTTP